MRIRKRQPLFPLPSVSDPRLINSSPVVQLNAITPPSPHLDHSPPSGHPLPPIGKPTDASDDSPREGGVHHQHTKQYGLEQDGRGRAQKKDNDPRKGSILGSETVANLVLSPSSSSPSNQDGRWCEGEKAIPLKKRRGRLERIKMEEKEEEEEEVETLQNNNKKAKSKMKTKMNKKCSRTQNDNDQDHEDEEDDDKDNNDEDEVGEERKGEGNLGRKRGRGRGRGSAVMEGSRCSRVNGRGWRCCQQTLVGYSLCEHHLGKGRLRSITSVKTRSVATNHIAPPPPLFSGVSTSSSSPDQKQTEFDALGNKGEDHKEAVIITKKRMKLGVVKARSISSLLGQTNTQVAVAPHSNNK